MGAGMKKEAGAIAPAKNLVTVCGGTRDSRCRGVRDGQGFVHRQRARGRSQNNDAPQPVLVISIRLEGPDSVKT
jgi:hypothetical protein